MWIEEGFSPAEFWEQTGRSFQIVMEGRFDARKYEHRRDTTLAWQIGNFSGAASCGKLKSLNHYLKKPVKDPREMLAVLHSIKSAGAKMTIRRVEA